MIDDVPEPVACRCTKCKFSNVALVTLKSPSVIYALLLDNTYSTVTVDELPKVCSNCGSEMQIIATVGGEK